MGPDLRPIKTSEKDRIANYMIHSDKKHGGFSLIRDELEKHLRPSALSEVLINSDLCFYFDWDQLPYSVVVAREFETSNYNRAEVVAQIWPTLMRSITRRVTVTAGTVVERA
jgi:hypothetical protein